MIVKLPESELQKILDSQWFQDGYIELRYTKRPNRKRLFHSCQALSILMGTFYSNKAREFSTFEELIPYLEGKVKRDEDLRRIPTFNAFRNGKISRS